MDELDEKTFTGLIVPAVPIRPQDYVQGAENNPLGALGYRIENPTGKWSDFRPPAQIQASPVTHWDTQDCTGFGYCREVASYLNYKLKNGLLPAVFVDWATNKGYIKNGSFMFDPRVLGVMAGTTGNGNWLQVVADTARKNGLLPADTLQNAETYDGPENYATYYDKNLITPAIKELGQEFLQWVDLPYQWLIVDDPIADVQQALKACPLYVALATCNGWNKPPVPWCNAGDASNHCVCQTEAVPLEVILDSYNPDLKTLSAGYNVPFRMMILTTIKTPMITTTGYKKANNATIYVQVNGGAYVPVADWQAFLNIGGSSNTVKTLSDADFALLNKVDSVLFKTK